MNAVVGWWYVHSAYFLQFLALPAAGARNKSLISPRVNDASPTIR